MIKTRCVGIDCTQKLPGTEEHYEKHGNFCTRCEWKAGKQLRDKQMQNALFHSLTGDEETDADLMLLFS